MFHLQRSKISLLALTAQVSSGSSLRGHRSLYSLILSLNFKRNYTSATRNILDHTSFMKDSQSELFNYTSGRFLANDTLRLRERSLIFNIPGLFNIITRMQRCQTEAITGFQKLGEGGLNRAFLITLESGLQLVARIPYPLVTPKSYAVASEVATVDFLRSKGLPIPKVYTYSFTSENEAGTPYIIMEYVNKGIDLSDIWWHLKEDEIISVMDQLAKLESTMMSIAFPAGGSIYYARDLRELSGKEGIPLDEQINSASLEKERFCLGPDVSVPLWYGRREQLNVFRGPYEDAESVLTTGAKKELAYLDQFGSPRQPYNRLRREFYKYEKQSPSEHAKNLQRYLRLAPSLVPGDDSMNTFCIRHPDLTPGNIKVSTDSSGLQIISVLDWQHAAVLPVFLHASMPSFIQNEDDEVSRRMIEPKLPQDFEKLSEEDQEQETELLRRRLVHYNYVISTAAYNWIHHKALIYPLHTFRRRIYYHATYMWEGETINLLNALMDMVSGWPDFRKDGSTPCPVVFTDEERHAANKLYQALRDGEKSERMMLDIVGCSEETWVPVDRYEKSKAIAEKLKQMSLQHSMEDEELTEHDRAMIKAHWPLDDVPEEELEEYK